MANYRRGRINEAIAKELAVILRSVKDYRLENTVVSITSVNCAPDLSFAKVYFSYLGSGSPKEIKQGLNSASGYIRTQLARTLNLRQTPKLVFAYDDSMEHGAQIAGLMQKVEKELEIADARDAAEAAAAEAAALAAAEEAEDEEDEEFDEDDFEDEDDE
ncbi:MAG: 30S ribosome-binding factor RbfA [Clostridia bacterium]|nr:30S ribosome-binding factor RbfA [Clostridia bacterium]